jgi:hypothetical protein
MNWVFISQRAPFFIATAVKTPNLTKQKQAGLSKEDVMCLL